jgi:hypothetical protein
MILAAIASGTAVFVDANTFVYALAPDPLVGRACEQIARTRVERRQSVGALCHVRKA